MTLALVACVAGCRCGSESTLTTFFTDVVWSKDGDALVLHATDGIYVARPLDTAAQRVSDQTCSASATKSLECVRTSPDARHLLILTRGQALKKDTVWQLLDVRAKGAAAAEGFTVVPLGADVFDAALSQDGAELVFARPGGADQTFDLYHTDPSGKTAEIVQGLALGGAAGADALKTIVVTPYGVAYALAANGALDLHFRPWERQGFKIGALVKECAGTTLPACVLASADGTSLAWQEAVGAVIHVYRAQQDVDLPLGQGYAFAFSSGGSLMLRMDSGPDVADVQRVETAVVSRGVLGALTAELSQDGESVAFLKEESAAHKTWRLFLGSSRRDGQDRDLGVVSEPTGHPLLAPSIGQAPVGHALTGDARFVVVDQPPSAAASGAALLAFNTDTGETRELDTLTCDGCCFAAPAGSLLVCVPTMSAGSVSGPAPVDLYDPATGKKTRATEKAIDLALLFDGSGVAVLEYVSDIPEAFVATKDGQRTSFGQAVRVAAAPDRREIAVVSDLGQMSLHVLP